ncbi:MAG TPA: hypothetical protein VGL86_06140 [Polyangia bacterium]|jgi:hypothetical protein
MKSRSARTASGTAASSHTIDSSSALRVIDVSAPAAHDGIGASGGRRATANEPATRASVGRIKPDRAARR